MQFLRSTGRLLVRPEVLGLPSTTGRGEAIVERSARLVQAALIDGDDDAVRQTVFDLYLANHALADIFDKVIAAAFHEIGEAWECHEVEVYQERRACEICLRVLHDLQSAMTPPRRDAPQAVGATLSGDYYQLPTAMVQLVLRSHGWRAISLGTNLPAQTLAVAIARNRPQLFWLSISNLTDVDAFVAEYERLWHVARDCNVPLVIDGRALTAERRARMQFSSFCEQMRGLTQFLQSMPTL
jgi:methanogenic corrinoid protein MtbC1